MKEKALYAVKRLTGFWPPSQDPAQRLIYDLRTADEEYRGKK